MDGFDNILANAGAAVSAEYFYLPIAGSDPVYRERVYCYELYHQMRSRWPADTRYRLNGEIDKRSHHLLEELGVEEQKPDFLVHEPGTMELNYAIIEVKHVDSSPAGIQKDLNTLRLFHHQVGYARAIFLGFGISADQAFVDRAEQAAESIGGAPGIELWLHSDAGIPVRHLHTLG
jgi:hypothetical protein